MAASKTERLPEGTEARLADEQAALVRLATVVADGAPPHEIFSAVSDELAELFASSGLVLRFEEDGLGIVSVGVSTGNDIPVGARWEFEEGMASLEVYRTGSSARVDAFDWSSGRGPAAETAERIDIVSSVSNPILVQNRLWGAVTVFSTSARLPDETEDRLERFSRLVATAIENAESREAVSRARHALERVAAEQAALRRVATLVSQGAAPADVFATVSAEVDGVFHLDPGTFDVAGVVRFEPGPELVVVGVSRSVEAVPLGARFSPDELFAPAHVLRTERSARIRVADLEAAGTEAAGFLRHHGYLSQVASPIVVEGRLWGAISVNSRNDLPLDTEERLERFTELVATAIANAESRGTLAQLADEQAALRRVATLVAKEDLPEKVFAKVAEETGRLLGGVECTLLRSERDGAATNVGTWGDKISAVFPVETRFFPDGDGVAATVLRTGHPHRIDDYSAVADPLARSARDRGTESSVGCPIVVRGTIWGAILVGTTGAEPFPPETETRLIQFADLVATAVANAEARVEIARLADEQAALRRVATLVAEGAPPDALFRAVADEVASVVGLPTVTLSHHHADGSFTVVAATNNPGFPVGSRWLLDGPSLAATIHETGRVARIDDYSNLGGAVAAAMHDSLLRAAAGSPIVVDGKVWGHISVAAKGAEPLPAGTEQRLLDFTELLATAISNAESGDALARLADEQAALRRVATLVARDASPGEVFNAVAMEVGKVLDADTTVVGRYDGDGAATATGSWSASPGGVPVGTRSVLGGHNVLTLVGATEQPARVEGYDDASGEAAEIARRHGWRSSIAAPIIVEGRLWGVMLVATQRPEPFPAGAEERLGAFTDLVATALANAQAHDEVRRFGEEQAALGRVATLVAAGAAPAQVFRSVVDEASSLLGLELVAFGRFDDDDTATIVAASAKYPVAPGNTWSLKDPSVIATVAHTKRAARIDDYGDLKGETARAARSRGFRSAIGAPLTVEGRLWGAIIAYSTDPEPIPERSETRLGQFTELVATAVANAEARQALERVAAEQATLRRIATLVAQGVQPEQLFAAVAEETAATFHAITALMRFEHDPPGVVLVGVSRETGLSIGTRWEFAEGMASAEVHRTGRSARFSSSPDYWSSRDGPVAEAGRRLGIVSQLSCPIAVEGDVWGVITVNAREELPPDTEQRLEKFTDLVSTAIANAEGKSELAASRRRIVAAADEARRRIERDLHDGIQQRLIALSFRARAMTRRPPDELPGIAAELSEGLKDVSEELREVSRGIHPTILTEAGLGPALRALARRSDIPIDVDVSLDERLPAPIEAAAYYIASEALTNVAKHAHANVVQLIASNNDGVLTLEVRDDGIGGVDATRGSGILGLTDRAEALGGTISIASPRGGGTTLSVRLPGTT
jgi:GAF domain-containing protein